MIDSNERSFCRHFQEVAGRWLRSGEVTRTAHLLSPLEELAGFQYGFIYLMRVDAQTVKIGYSEHPTRRLRELQPAYRTRLRLQACFVGDPQAERFAHRRFAALRMKNDSHRSHLLAHLRPTRSGLDLRMLQVWLSRQ